MSSNRESRHRGAGDDHQQAIVEWIGLLGRALSSYGLYGPDHQIARRAVRNAHDGLRGLLGGLRRLDLGVLDGQLLADGQPVPTESTLMRLVKSKLESLEITSLSFIRGMEMAEFARVVDLLHSLSIGGGGGVNEALSRRGLEHIRAQSGSYRRVEDDEEVVKRGAPAAAQADEPESPAAAPPVPAPAPAPPQAASAAPETGGRSRVAAGDIYDLDTGGGFDAATDDLDIGEFMKRLEGGTSLEDVEIGTGIGTGIGKGRGKGGGGGPNAVQNIVAFLKGDTPVDAERLEGDLADAANDPDKLAALIIESAVVRQRSQGIVTGESLADLVIGALRRTYDGLNKAKRETPDFGDPVKKSLLLLEQNVLAKLHDVMNGVDQFEAMVALAEIDVPEQQVLQSMAAEYVRRKRAFTHVEERMVRMVRDYWSPAAGTGIHDALQEAGLPPPGWNELVAKSGTGRAGKGSITGSGGGAGIDGDVGVLAALLTQLDSLMSADLADPAKMNGVVKEIGTEVGRLAERTSSKIDALAAKRGSTTAMDRTPAAASSPSGRSGTRPPVDYSDTDELLAEIVQELCQPATVISCTMAMVTGGFVGAFSDDQQDLLSTVGECSQRLSDLLERLRHIVGLPSDFVPKAI